MMQSTPSRQGANHDKRFALATALFQQKNYEQAHECYLQLLSADPANPELLLQTATCLIESHSLEQALVYLKRILLINDHHSRAFMLLGVCHDRLNHGKEDIACFHQSIVLEPNGFQAHYNLGIALFKHGDFSASLKALNHALALQPDSVAAHYNLGVLANEQEQHELALSHYQHALALDPQNILIAFNLGVTQFELSRPHAAALYYQRTLALSPDHIKAHWNLSHSLLMTGDYENGFKEYEWRWQHNRLKYDQSPPQFNSTQWMGETSLEGKSILIHAEQGFGDTLQFVRFVNHPMFDKTQVVLQVQGALLNLIGHSFPKVKTISQEMPAPTCDFHIPLMSLPLALGIVNERQLMTQPYLRVDHKISQTWSKNTANYLKPRVGLVWSSGYRKEQVDTWKANQKRNLKLLDFAFLKKFDAHFFSLQKGFIPESELAALIEHHWGGPPIIDLTHELTDFEQTAALIQHLDLIVTVDTSVAHLAAALGKPTFLYLKFNADWRWHHLKSHSAWYPSIEIFRQTAPNTLSQVLYNLQKRLDQWFVT